MRKICIVLLLIAATGCSNHGQLLYNGLPEDLVHPKGSTVLEDSILYHPVHVDSKGHILPWFSANLGESYDHVLNLVWNFWKNMEVDSNGMQYYMNHQVWKPEHDKRGLGGDQLMMAMSSWDLYYNYTGDESLIDNMRYMADYYLAHSLSSSDSEWPHLPYPYNMDVESGIYDGDMIIGKGYLQPDKAGSFGYELVHLYKKTGEERYLEAAVNIANTLAEKVQPGDNDNSPWPFKVNAETGEVGVLVDNETWYEGMDQDVKSKTNLRKSSYTTFWTGTLNLFRELIDLNQGNQADYEKAYDMCLEWMKNYPAKTNKWGPFFEDVPRWSDTQINAVTYAMFLMENPEADPNWKVTVNNIFKWVHAELDNKEYVQYGVIPTNEQTAYRQPGNSHSSRQASMELRYWEITGDTTYVRNAVRQLNWATYMVDHDGKNFYPTNAIWMTDGYGDYSRHYLRAMAAAPELAPDQEDHLLRSSSVVKKIVYQPNHITYTVFDSASTDLLRVTFKPEMVTVDGQVLEETSELTALGWSWQPLDRGGVLTIRQGLGRTVEIAG